MKPQVDQDLCIGCGLCAELAPDVFELDENELSTVVGEVTDDNELTVDEAVESCPTSAISMS